GQERGVRHIGDRMAEPKRFPQVSVRTAEALAHRVIFEAVWKRAWRVLTPYGFQGADREEVAQNVVVRAWEKRSKFRAGRGSPNAWIGKMTRNAAAGVLRSQARSKEVLMSDPPEDVVDEALDPEQTKEWSELAELANHEFSFIPEAERR